MDHTKSLYRLLESNDEANFNLAHTIDLKESKRYIEEKYGNFIDIYFGGDCERDFWAIQSINNMKYLTINNSQTLQLIPLLGIIRNLLELFILSNSIDNSMVSINNCKSFNLLKISHCIINKGSLDGINNQAIKKVCIDECNLNYIPIFLGNLKKIEYIDLGFNAISEIPDWIGDLTNLEDFLIPMNNISHILDSIGSLINLNRISFTDNPISYIPESFYDLNIGNINCNLHHIKIPRFQQYMGDLYRGYLNSYYRKN